MVQVRGTVHDVSDNPDRVEKIIVRAVEPRMHGTTYITEEPTQFPVVDGVLDFNVLPGPCVVAFLRNHGATTYEKLLVPDVAEATFKECLDAADLAEGATKATLEDAVRQVQEELSKVAPLVSEVRTLHTEVSNDRTAADGFAKAAQKSASDAATSQSKAKTSETNAANSAASAKSQQESAKTHFNNTVKEAEKAANSATAAKTSETNAASSASASASSASSSKTQAGKSAASATQAAASRDAAKASETAAAGSATAAKSSETNAAQSSSTANTHRAAAATQASAASESASQAATARDAAKQSQTAAKTSETNANKHRQAAATSESNAATHKTNAGESAAAAASSAAEAKGHADRAEVASDPEGLRNEMTKQFAALVDGAPEDLDTIREIAEYAQANRDVTDQLNAAIGNKANKSHTHVSADISNTTSELMSINPNRVVRTNADGAISIHNHTITGDYSAANKAYVDGEVAKKANKSHTHSQSQVTGLTTALSGKSDTGHKHTTSEITDFATEMSKKANSSHTHTQAQVSGLSTALDGKADKAHTHDLATLPGRISNEQAPDVTIIGNGVDLNTYETTGVFAQNMNAYAAAGTNYPVDRAGLLVVAQSSGMTYQTYTVYSSGAMYYRGKYTQKWGSWKEVSTEGHTHTTSEVTGLSTALSGKAAKSHTHTTSQVSGLDAALDGKADKSYVDSRPAIFTVPDINSASTENLVPGDVVVDTSTWIFYYLE